MTRPLFRGPVLLAATLACSLASTTPAGADTAGSGHAYDTVDAVQSGPGERQITITGIIAGQSTATTLTYQLRNTISGTSTEDLTARCDRFALLAMAKPGRYQFVTIRATFSNTYDCALTMRAP